MFRTGYPTHPAFHFAIVALDVFQRRQHTPLTGVLAAIEADCQACGGRGWVRLNHAASATCYSCDANRWQARADIDGALAGLEVK